MVSLSQPNFASGELTPLAQGRTDLTRYGTGLRTCRNWIIRPHGCLMNRPGTEYIAATRNSGSKKSRLVPFEFSDDQAYMLEFSEGFMRVYSNGVYTAVEVATPYLESDLDSLQWAQSADVLTLTLRRLPQYEVRRTSTAPTFTVTQASYTEGPFLTQNADTTIKVAVSAITGAVTLTASSAIFAASHVGGLFRLEQENVDDVKPWEPTKILQLAAASPVGLMRRNDGKTYQCTAPIPPGGTVNTATGSVPPTHDAGTVMDGDGNKITSFADIVGVSWLYLDSGYGVVRITGFTSSTIVTGTVVRQLPTTLIAHSSSLWSFGAWSPNQGYPTTVTYFQDRLFFAGTTGQPQGVWASKTGQYTNFGTSVPSQDDDALSFFLNARKINAISDLIPLESLLAVTSSGVWQVTDGTDEVLTPSTVGFKPQNQIGGAPAVRSAIVGDSAIYPQLDRRRVRDLLFSFQTNKFLGTELSLLAEHLFPFGTAITRVEYAQYPFSLLHVIRDDGVMPTLSYLREQDVIGWGPWDTNGAIQDMCSILEGGITRTYVIVNRSVNGSSVRYIERFANREFADIRDAYFVDAGASYDGRAPAGVTMILTGGSTWLLGEALTLTASLGTGWGAFTSNDVGNEVWLETTYEVDGEEVTDAVRVRITSVTGPLIVSVVPISDVPASLRATAVTDWTFAKKVITGLSHLEGEEVLILADGMDVDPQTVVSGAVTLLHPGGVVHAGLGYESDLETLDVNVPGAPTVRNKTKTIPSVSVLVYQTRGLFVGPDEDHLDEIAQRMNEDLDEPIDLQTGIQMVPVPTRISLDGHMFLRQSRPLPVTITGLIPDVEFGE